jgi:hypothetical protein
MIRAPEIAIEPGTDGTDSMKILKDVKGTS